MFFLAIGVLHAVKVVRGILNAIQRTAAQPENPSTASLEVDSNGGIVIASSAEKIS